MPFSLSHKGSKKSLPKIKAPVRSARLFQDGAISDKKPQAKLKKISINLDGIVSSLLRDGNWFIDHESKGDSKYFIFHTQVNEKQVREKELLKRRNEILIELAKAKTEEIDVMEKELRKLRRIVKKCAPMENKDNSRNKNRKN